jgi:catechol 2,3-dioxygenase-like lactoylglutathione lyase family enzyme
MIGRLMLALDHAVILVRDLDAAALGYGRLGFALTPRGRHPRLHTANHTLVFERDYLELLSVERPTAANRVWATTVDRGEGLGALALATDDARETRHALRERGVAIGDPIDFVRPVALPTGPVDARFTVCHLPSAASPAIAAFFCQHHTPSYVWRADCRRHPNTARGIVGVTVVVRDPARAAARYERWLGRASVHPRPGGATLSLGPTSIWLVTPAYAEARLARLVPDAPRPLGLTVAVADLTAARRLLAANDVPFDRFAPRSILVEPTWTHGVVLELLQA